VAKQEFVIGGWPESDRGRPFASLPLGFWQNGKLRYTGRVGAGCDEHDLQEPGRELRVLEDLYRNQSVRSWAASDICRDDTRKKHVAEAAALSKR
jgi:ATP-dependent DNA ligase